MTCEAVIVAFTLSLKAFSGSSVLTAVPGHFPAFTAVGCTRTLFFSDSLCMLCHLQRCNGRDEVSLISLAKHSCHTMFLIISHNEPLCDHSTRDVWIGFCVFEMMSDGTSPVTITAWGPGPSLCMVSWFLTVFLWVMVSHVKPSRFEGRERGDEVLRKTTISV